MSKVQTIPREDKYIFNLLLKTIRTLGEIVRNDLPHEIYLYENEYFLITYSKIYSADTFDDVYLVANNLHCIQEDPRDEPEYNYEG
jgi:hypothetical protein